MAKVDIARALKDSHYFNSLTAEEKAQVKAADPSGEMEVNDTDLDSVSGGLGERVAAISGSGSTGTVTGTGTTSRTIEPQNCNCNC